MLTRVDRVQQVVRNAHATAAAYVRLLGAEIVRDDEVHVLGARRLVLRCGGSAVELLEPRAAGPAADFLACTGGGLFATGVATPDPARLRAHLQARDVAVAQEGGQLFLTPAALGVPGLHVVVSVAADQAARGFVRGLYEVTLLAADPAARLAAVFGLDATHFTPIRSAEFGYDGMLTLFHPNRLDRLEVIRPTDPAKTMGRFFAKRGPSLYMCYAEADDLRLIRECLHEHAPGDWTGPRGAGEPLNNLFIHPQALGGMMLGVSRTGVAWMWSGHPERVPEAGGGPAA
jgi:Glyoxalase/Bleomycin resistance protein/Dioxygenase superfamily